MVEPRIATLPFGFQEPTKDDFSRVASRLLVMAETEIARRRRSALLMLVPSMAYYLLFAFGVGVLLWSVGVELRPVPMAVVTAVSFLAMAGLGIHYENELDWAGAAGGLGRIHRRLLVQGLAVNLLTGAFFTLPASVLKNLAALFPRRPRVDGDVLALAANLAAALNEPAEIVGPDAIIPRDLKRSAVNEAVVLLLWARVASVIRRTGRVILQPEQRRHVLLSELANKQPFIVYVSALSRNTRQ
ncbi:MAG TPA: hypothetical protein VLB51_11520 [Methylomirabilota bacterium]|nr:hypothetical protein [Methylomirabilota bacterium]